MEIIEKEKFNELIGEGIAIDIFLAERSYTVFKTISDYADRINTTGRGYTSFFGCTQTAFLEQCILSTARIYDPIPKNPKYVTRCVDGVLKFLKENAERLPSIIEKSNLYKEMKISGFELGDLNLVNTGTDPQITNAIVTHFSNYFKEVGIISVVKKLRDVRDKRLAHNENYTGEIISPSLLEIKKLIEGAKSLVSIIGWAYLSIAFRIEGEYILTDDAIRIKFSAEKVLNDLLANSTV